LINFRLPAGLDRRSTAVTGTGAPRGEGARDDLGSSLSKTSYVQRSDGHRVHDGGKPVGGGL